jgi:hypothetical protein
MSKSAIGRLAGHGLASLSSLDVDSYNLDVRDDGEILNHRLRRAAFSEIVDKLNKDHDGLLAGRDAAGLRRKDLEAALKSGDKLKVELVKTAIDAFANEMAYVISRFLKTREWKGVQRIVIGGGFRKGKIGKQCFAKASQILASDGAKVELVPIRHDPDDAGVLGGIHLLPAWMVKGHDAMLCADIGGTNLRVGVVSLKFSKAADLSRAEVVERDIWRHAEDDPRRTETVATLVRMARRLIRQAQQRGNDLVPAMAIACPGVIDHDGSILSGGVNLPGGNWESERFNLVAAVGKQIGRIGDHPAEILLHNDAVVQGLSQRPWMNDVRRWGVMTIGTGLGNACFTNKDE